MKNDILKEFKKEYNQKIEDTNRITECIEILKHRRSILENSPLVKDYIELSNQINDLERNNHSADDIFKNLFNKYNEKGLTTETNDILIYVGTYILEIGVFYLVDRNNKYADFDLYIDIESLKKYDNAVEDREDFEKNHTIIFLDDDKLFDLSLEPLRTIFIRDALDNGQEEAVKKILTRKK